GSGVLAELADGLTPTIGDLVYMALSISDNTAANMLIQRVGGFSVTRRLGALGLAKTRLSGRILVQETASGPAADEDFGTKVGELKDDRDDGRGEGAPRTVREP